MDEVFAVFASFQLIDMISGPLRGIKAAMGATQAAAGRLSAGAAALTKKLLPLAAAAGLLLMGLAGPVRTAADFEQSMSAVGAVSRASTEEMATLEQAALSLGASTAWSASQVAEAEKYLAMAGFNVQQNVAALPGVLNLASAGNTDLARTADIASDILSGFGLEASRMSEVADTLTVGITTANTNLELLGDTMKYVAPVASAAGMSLAEATAMAGLLGNVGIKGSQAGTTLRAMLVRLAAPAAEGAATLKRLGVSAADATGALRSPIAVLGDMAQAMEGMGSADQLAAISDVFGQIPMAGMSELIKQQGMGGITKYLAVIKDSAGAAADVAGRQLDNLKGVITILGSAWEGLQITIGKVFLPVLKPLVSAVATAVSWFNALAGTAVGKFIIGLVGVLATGVLAITAMTAAAWGLSAALPFVSTALAPVAGLVAAISWPVWLVIAAVGALLVAFKTNFGGIRDFVLGWWNRVNLVFQGVRAVFASLKGGAGELSGELRKSLEAAGLVGVVTAISRVIYRLQQVWSGVVAGFGAAMDGIGDAFTPLLALGDAFTPLLDALSEVVAMLFGTAGATDVSGWRLFGQVIGAVVGGAFRILAVAVRVALTPIEILLKVIRTIGQVLNGEIDLFEAGRALVMTFVDGIKSVIMAPVELLKSGLGKLRELLPFSDAKTGPLSTLTLSGQRLTETFGAGIQRGAGGLAGVMESALSGAMPGPELALAVSGPAPGAAAGSGKSRASVQQTGRQVVIQNLTVNLPGVGSASDFVTQLQQLVEGYDGD
ncbi:MAG: hypothetical protein PWQ57_914 [Desulfovibrionales bacterium]|nr:hypothetical protein [Desulfovibrionales bacterium]